MTPERTLVSSHETKKADYFYTFIVELYKATGTNPLVKVICKGTGLVAESDHTKSQHANLRIAHHIMDALHDTEGS